MIQIEIPKGSMLKMEENRLDRLLLFPNVQNYGFIEDSSIQEDGDLQDCFVISEQPLPTGTRIDRGLLVDLGVLHYNDNGENDNKRIYAIKPKLGLTPDFFRTMCYEVSCIISYLRYYKNMNNKVTLVNLSAIWPDEYKKEFLNF